MPSFARGATRAPVPLILMLASIAAGAEGPPKSYKESPEIVQGRQILWHDPGAVEQIDLRYGPSGPGKAPQPPFQFVKEDPSGRSPKVNVRDANGQQWNVKFGEEAKPDTFGARLASALGYFSEANYFVANGTILGVHDLVRARDYIDREGRFTSGARFQLRSKDPEYLVGWSWAWNDNPFLGTREFNGLRILMMLISNWDNKDLRDESGGLGSRIHQITQYKRRGTNNAIYRDGGRYLFFIDDWGASMGSWGGPMERSKSDCANYANQSDRFVRASSGDLQWGYTGIHTPDMTSGITVADVQWLMQFLGRISDAQLRDGLLASGANPDQAYCYTMALRTRINQLKDIAREPAATRAQ